MTHLLYKIDNRIRLIGELGPEIKEVFRKGFTYVNPDYGRQLQYAFKSSVPRKLVTYRVESPTEMSFARGSARRIREILRAYNIPFQIQDLRTEGFEKVKGAIPDAKIQLYPYQEPVLQSVIEKQNCLMRLPTGSGKSTIALAMAAKLKLPTLVIVWSGNLYDQWETRAKKELGLDSSQIGRIRGGQFDLKPFTLAMQQTIASRGVDDLVSQYFGLVIADEVQKFAAPTLYSSVDPFKSKYRLGISADETRRDGKQVIIYDLFGSVAAEIERGVLINSGHILDVDLYLIPTQFKSPGYEYTSNFVTLLDEIIKDEDRNKMIVDLILREYHKGESVIFISHRREHCKEIASMVGQYGIVSGLMLGGYDFQKEFRETRRQMESGEVRVSCGTLNAIGQGLDIPRVGVVVIGTPMGTNRQQFGQVRGRVCRSSQDKVEAKMYYFWDREIHRYDAHLRNFVHWNNRVYVQETLETSPIVASRYKWRRSA
jgi:superfamily II DNA or RNA helicase